MRKWAGILLAVSVIAFAVTAGATVTGTSSRVEYTGNGSTTVFSFTFSTKASTHVKVYLAGVVQTVGYSVVLNADQTVNPGGSVTFTPAPFSGTIVRIQREEPLTAETVYPTYGQYQSKVIERDFDSRVRQLQQIDRRIADAEVEIDTLDAREAADVADLQLADFSNLTTILNAVAALNTGSHAVGDTTSILAFGTTTARTLTARFADVFNVKDFGANGDGVTPGQEVFFQRALDAVSSEGGTVVVPCGDYIFSGAILPKSNTRLQGQGPCSLLHMQDAAWNIHELPGDRNIGMVTIYDVQNVHVTGLTFRGSTTMDCSSAGGFTYCPQLLQITSATAVTSNVSVDNNSFGPTAGTATWAAGNYPANSLINQNIRFENNYYHDIGYDMPTPDPGVGIQLNMTGVVVTGNFFYRVGIGVAGTGRNLVISGNLFRDFWNYGVWTGDYTVCRGVSITGNLMYARITGTEHDSMATAGIVTEVNAYSGEGYTGLMESGFTVTGNIIHYYILTNSTLSVTGIQATNADAQIANNAVSYDFQTNYVYSGSNPMQGIRYYANERNQTVVATANSVDFYSTNSSTYDSAGITGIGVAISSSPSRTLTLLSNHNRVTGLSTLGAAFSYGGTSSAILKLYMTGDIATGGTMLVGTAVSYTNRPIYQTYDSTAGTYEGTLFLGGLEVGNKIRGSAYVNAGSLTLYGQTTAGSGNPAIVIDTSEALLSNDPILVVKNHGVYKYWITNTGKVDYLDVCDLTGTPGPGTCNKPAGKALIAASAASVVITSDQVTAASGVLVEIQANDATCTAKKSVIPVNGSFTVTMNAACTADTKFFWVAHN